MPAKYLKIVMVLIACAVVIQFVPVDRSNPPVVADLSAPETVREVLRQSCYDCHSNETVWPWYSRLAPVSWLVAFDVHEGRGHLNFSLWGNYPAAKQNHLKREIWEVVDEGEMPPFQYLPAHPDARLDDQDKSILRNWSGF